MKYARVQDGVVREVFDAKPVFHPDLMAQIMEAPDTVRQGQVHDGSVFRDPPPPPTTARERILEIERQITPRRLRDAILGRDAGWLAARESEISALRASI